MSSTIGFVPAMNMRSYFRATTKFGLTKDTSISGHHLATKIIQDRLGNDWNLLVPKIKYSVVNASISQYQFYESFSERTATTIPVARVACSSAKNLPHNSTAIEFPVLPEYASRNGSQEIDVSPNNSSTTDHLQTRWVALPPQFGSISTGLVFEAPRSDINTSRLVVGCSIDARWTSGVLSTDDNGDVGGEPVDPDPRGPNDNWGPNSDFRPYPNSSWKRITLQESWLDELTPVAPQQPHGYQGLKTLEILLSNSGIAESMPSSPASQVELWNTMTNLNRVAYMEWMISLLVADGLSRYGSTRVLNTSGAVSEWSILDYDKRSNFNMELLDGHSGSHGYALEMPDYPDLYHLYTAIAVTGYTFRAVAVGITGSGV
jgi:hypothetical protein